MDAPVAMDAAEAQDEIRRLIHEVKPVRNKFRHTMTAERFASGDKSHFRVCRGYHSCSSV
jgi:hypothetical protein